MSILQVLTFLSCMFLFDQKPKLLFISLFFHFCSCTKYCLQYLHTVLYQLSPGYYTHQTLLSYVQLASQQAKQSSHVYEYVCKAVWVWNTLKSAGFFTDNLWFGYWLTISSRVARASRTGRQSHLQYWRRERHKRTENTSHRNITNKIGPCVCLFVPLLRTIFMSRTQFQRFMCCIKKESLQFSDDGVEECPRAPRLSLVPDGCTDVSPQRLVSFFYHPKSICGLTLSLPHFFSTGTASASCQQNRTAKHTAAWQSLPRPRCSNTPSRSGRNLWR